MNMNRDFIYNPAGFVKNFSSLRAVCFWAGGLGLVQSIVWIALTATGILSYSCVISVYETTFNYGNLISVFFQQLYFMGACDKTVPTYNDTMLQQVNTVLSPQDIVIWNSVYLAVAICWLLASLLLMKYLKQDQPRIVVGILWTWILVTFFICAMDFVLAIIFGIDYGRFSSKAYNYNLDKVYGGAVNPDAAQLLAGMVVSMSMLILSLKGFILWLINVGLLAYLSIRAILIGQDNSGMSNLYITRKQSDDILATRPPINAYQEDENQKPSILATAFTNEAYETEKNYAQEKTAVINPEIIARAARLSSQISQHERHFRSLDNFKQYPPRSRPQFVLPEHTQQQQQQQHQNQQQQHPHQQHQQQDQQTSSIIASDFPEPDYTPPMQRAAQSPKRNQKFQ